MSALNLSVSNSSGVVWTVHVICFQSENAATSFSRPFLWVTPLPSQEKGPGKEAENTF